MFDAIRSAFHRDTRSQDRRWFEETTTLPGPADCPFDSVSDLADCIEEHFGPEAFGATRDAAQRFEALGG